MLVGVVAVGSLLVMVQHNAGLARYDLGAAHWGATNATSGFDAFPAERQPPRRNAGHDRRRQSAPPTIEYVRTRNRAVIGFLALVVIGQLMLQNVTKAIVDRDRPDIHRLTGFSGSSFPSGHAMTAAATFAAVALLVGRGRSQRVKACWPARPPGIAVAVATTRVFLGVHWLTDVIAGLAMGWAWFAISSIAFGGRVLALRRAGRGRPTRREVVRRRIRRSRTPDVRGEPRTVRRGA